MSDRGGIDVGSAHGEIVIGSDLKGIDQASQALTGFDQKSAKASQGLNALTNTAALVGGGIAAGLGLAVGKFADFESEMLAVKAVSGATGEEFQKLTDLAKQIGQDTVFSASEAASALEELSKAGVGVDDILNGAAEGATNLAAAAGEGIPEAATQIATALNEFQLAGDQATRVADIFTNVSNKSAASATSFGDALRYVGTQAHTLNIPLEQTAAAIAALADAGLDGSTAGTSLNAALSSLVAPTLKQIGLQEELGLQIQDSSGNFVGLDSILRQVADATRGMGDAQKQATLNMLAGERGSRALNVLLNAQNTTLADGTTEWQGYQSAMLETGSASEQAETRLSGLSGSFEQLRGSVETMEIEFGENLAPAIGVAADALTGVVNAFSQLPEGFQTAIVGVGAATAGLLLLGAAGGKAILIGRQLIGAWRDVGGRFIGAQKGCGAASGCLESLGPSATTAERGLKPLLGTLGKVAGFGVIAVALEIEIDAAINAVTGHSSQLEGLGVWIGGKISDGLRAGGADSIADAVEDNVDAAQANMDERDIALELGFSIDQKKTEGAINAVFQGALDAIPGGTLVPEKFIPDFQHANDEIEELGLTFAEVEERAAAAGKTVEEFLRIEAVKHGLLIDAPAGLDKLAGATAAYAKSAAAATEAVQDGTQAEDDGATAAEEHAKALQGLLDKRGEDADKAALEAEAQRIVNREFIAGLQAQGKAIPAVVLGAEDAQKAWDEWNQKVGELTQSMLVEEGALVDLGDGLVVANTGMNRLTDTTAGAVLQFDKFGSIRLTKSNREALELERTLEHVEDALARTDDEIANNQEDMGMWQGRISLVTDVLGGNTDALNERIEALQEGHISQENFNSGLAEAIGPFEKLDALLAAGKISQEQYNAAKEAGIHLIERSAGGIQDEDAQLVQNIIDLDKYVRAHDEADGAVNRLTDAQREFIAATKSDSVQRFIDDLAKLKAIEAPQDVITRFIVDSSQADPLIAAFVEDTQLLDGKEVHVTLTAENANRVLDDLQGVATFLVSLDGKSVTVHVDTEAQALQFAKENADALDGKEVTFVIHGDDGPVTKTLADLQGAQQPPITQTIDLQFAGVGDGTELLGAETVLPPIPPPPPVPITAADQTAEGVDAAKATIQTLSDVAEPEGEETGAALASGLATGAAQVQSTIDGFRSIINAEFQAIVDASRAWGNAAGANYAVSFINAISGLGQTAYNAGFNLGFNAYVGTQAGIRSGSPSRAALETGQNFANTFVGAIEAETAAAHQAGFSLANAAAMGAAGGFSDLATRAVFGGDAAAFTPVSAARPVAGGGGVAFVWNGSVNVTGGADSSDEIANRVRTEVVDGIAQLLSRRT